MSAVQFDELAKNMGVNITQANIDGTFDEDDNELDQAIEGELVEPIEEGSKTSGEGFAQETGLANNMAARTGATLLFSVVFLAGGYLGWQQFFPSANIAKDPQKTEKTNSTENPPDATVASNNGSENPADATQQQETPPQSAPSTSPVSTDPNPSANPAESTPNATGATSAGTTNTNAGTSTAVTTKPSPPIANIPKNPSAIALAGKGGKVTPTPAPIFVPTQVAAKNIPNTAVASNPGRSKSVSAPIVTAANNSSSTNSNSKLSPSKQTAKPQNDTASSPVITAFAQKPAKPQPSAFSGISNIGSSPSKASRNTDSVANLPPPPLNVPTPTNIQQSRDLPTATVGDSEVYGTAKALPGSTVDQATVAALPPPPLNPSTDTPPPKSDEAPPLTDYLTAQLDPSIAVAPQSQDNIPPPPIAPLAPPAIGSNSPPPALPPSDIAPPVAPQPQNTKAPLIENGLPPSDAAPISNAKLDTNISPQPEAKNTPSSNDGAVIVPPPSPETLTPLPVNPPQSRILMASANLSQPPQEIIFSPPGSGWTPRDFGAADQAKESANPVSKTLEKELKTSPSDIPTIIDESKSGDHGKIIPDLKLP
jgi:hypothetical protein